MKTNNFKLSFETIEDMKQTHISFGNAKVCITCYESSPLSFDKENYRMTYTLNDMLKFSVVTYDLPEYLSSQIRNLYYGFFAFDKSPFYKSPALETIACIRCIINYYKRINKPLL